MTMMVRMKLARVLSAVVALVSGCTLRPIGQTCDVDTYAEMVFPALLDMQRIAGQLASARAAGDIEQVKLWKTQYLISHNALKMAPVSWCTQQMHQEFLLSSEAYLNAVDLWLSGDDVAANTMVGQANQHWDEGWRAYDRIKAK
jgi:hypothetical protein